MEILGYIVLVYLCGFFTKFVLNIPVALRLPELIRKVRNVPDDERVKVLPGFGMIALAASGWPYLLYAEGFRFFVCPSKEYIDGFFTLVIMENAENDSE